MSPTMLRNGTPKIGFPRVSGDEPFLVSAITDTLSFPRVSGDEPFGWTNRDGSIGFSPRERG